MIYFSMLLFFGIPIAAIIFFIVTAAKYYGLQMQKDGVSGEELQNAKMWYRVAKIIMGILVVIVIGFIILLYSSISFM